MSASPAPTPSAREASPRGSSRRSSRNSPPDTGCPCPTPWTTVRPVWCAARATTAAAPRRALLRHTGGLYDFTSDTGGTVPLTPLQTVRIALPHPPTGLGRFSSSNTNYVLLGRVVERVTGRSYAAEAERRIITPLRPTGASFPGAHASLPPPHGRAYTADGPNVTELDPRGAGAAGEHGRGHGPALEPAVLAAEFCPRTP
ncbi:serine hydrolase [Streptomyces sp. NPDC048512]|uniref:serine hydrolase n=1 Tax=Streptomyces sp. NPDC048512 TaxID=3365563 RepID=UPI0037212869